MTEELTQCRYCGGQEAFDNLMKKHMGLMQYCKKLALVADEAEKHSKECDNLKDGFMPGSLILDLVPHPLIRALEALERQ